MPQMAQKLGVLNEKRNNLYYHLTAISKSWSATLFCQLLNWNHDRYQEIRLHEPFLEVFDICEKFQCVKLSNKYV